MASEIITVGILNHDNNVYEKYAGQSIKTLDGNFDLIIEENKNPAQAYNDIILKSKNRYIVLLHADVTFSKEFLTNIKQSIDQQPNFGALCCVGVIRSPLGKIKIITSEFKRQHKVVTADSCCLIINKQHNLLFDSNLFDEYHMYIEDYCTQIRFNLNLKIYTLFSNWIWIDDYKETLKENLDVNNWFVHHSHTFRAKGAKWGKWALYKNKLDAKWGRKIITT